MASRTVSFLRGEPYGEWSFGGRTRSYASHSDLLIMHRSDLDLCAAADLQWALRRAEYEGGPDQVHVSTIDEQHMDVEGIPVGPVVFQLEDDALVVTFTFVDESPEPEEEGDEARFIAALQPLLVRHKVTLLFIEGEDYQGIARIWTVRLGLPSLRGRTVAALYEAGLDMYDLMDALASGELSRETAGNLVRAGRADVLIGQPEGHWLEAKSQHYDLDTPGGEISLAQAVSRFCNSEEGGIVVVGMTTKKTAAEEQIRKLNPMPVRTGIVRKYHRVLEKRLFPLVRDLRIDAVASGPGSELILVDVPPQPEELKPFLVSGAIVDGKVDGAFISIVRRRGEGSVPTTAQEIHSTLVAGRALLRGGQVP